MAFREKVKDRGYRGEDSDDDTKERLSRSRSRSRSPPTSFHRHHLLKSNLSSYAYGHRLKTFRTFDDIFYELLVKIRKENLNPTDYNFTKQYIYNRYITIAKAEASAIVSILLDMKNGGSDAKSYRSNPKEFLDSLVTQWLASNNQSDFVHIKLNPADALQLKSDILIILNQEIKNQELHDIASGFASIETTQTRKKKLDDLITNLTNL